MQINQILFTKSQVQQILNHHNIQLLKDFNSTLNTTIKNVAEDIMQFVISNLENNPSITTKELYEQFNQKFYNKITQLPPSNI